MSDPGRTTRVEFGRDSDEFQPENTLIPSGYHTIALHRDAIKSDNGPLIAVTFYGLPLPMVAAEGVDFAELTNEQRFALPRFGVALDVRGAAALVAAMYGAFHQHGLTDALRAELDQVNAHALSVAKAAGFEHPERL